MKSLITDSTLKGLDPRMRQPMILIIPFLMKPLPAELADPWTISLVNAHVRVERRTAVEGLSTGLALVGLFVGVDDLVATQGGRLAEAFAAHFADEWTSTFKEEYCYKM